MRSAADRIDSPRWGPEPAFEGTDRPRPSREKGRAWRRVIVGG